MEFFKFLNISGFYFYILFFVSFLMWSYIAFIYLRLKIISRQKLKSERVQKKYYILLNTVFFLAGTAPIIGLLGTVDGVVDIFQGISLSSDVSAKLMAGGIGKALVTTQAGLVIAIPGLLSGNFIKENFFFLPEEKT